MAVAVNEGLYTFVILSFWILRKTRNFTDKICRKIKTYFMFNEILFFFLENRDFVR